MLQRLLPVLYALEFLIALIAVYTVWGEIGGLDYLDYVPWYWKAGIGFGTAAAIVKLTIAIAIERAGPSARWRITVWALVLAGLAICAGLLTYYYYLNEPQDDPNAPASVTPTARDTRINGG